MGKFLYYLAYAFLYFISILPMWILYFLSNIIYYTIYYIIGYRKKVVMENLTNSFPEKSKEEIVSIAKKYYRHLSDMVVETIKLINISPREIDRRVTYKGLEHLQRFHKEGRQVVAAMGHYNNWEWGTAMGTHNDFKTITTYKTMDNKYFDALFKRMRTRFNVVAYSMKETTRGIIKDIRNGEQILLVLVADQTPAASELHHYTTFLNQDTPIFMGPEKIAKSIDAVLVFMHMKKLRRGYYQMEYIPLCEDSKNTEPFELTNMQLRLLEEKIREEPQYWLWSHRRWKHKRTNITPDQQN